MEEVPVGFGYKTLVTGDMADGYVVTNSRSPELINVAGEKIWDDERTETVSARPKSWFAYGRREADQGGRNSGRELAWNFADKPKYENGVESVTQSVKIRKPEYQTEYDGYNVKNSHNPELVSITEKFGMMKRIETASAAEITIRLWADGVKSITSRNSGRELAWNFADKPNIKRHRLCTQSRIRQEYQTSVSGNAMEGFVVTNCYT